ncbi:MAG: chemotaxis protein CheW, partial [Proteobacteria bacterium]|nr:chemotaxis protein CheW [Pseudomonadota bacterium]
MSQATGSPSSPSTEESRFILFRLGKEQYAVNLTDVEEVLESPDMTSVPNTVPSFIGVCNVRGQIVGVLDLRKHFNISPCETTKPVVLIFNTET